MCKVGTEIYGLLIKVMWERKATILISLEMKTTRACMQTQPLVIYGI